MNTFIQLSEFNVDCHRKNKIVKNHLLFFFINIEKKNLTLLQPILRHFQVGIALRPWFCVVCVTNVLASVSFLTINLFRLFIRAIPCQFLKSCLKSCLFYLVYPIGSYSTLLKDSLNQFKELFMTFKPFMTNLGSFYDQFGNLFMTNLGAFLWPNQELCMTNLA